MAPIIWANKSNQFFMMLPHQFHRFGKIAIVRNNDSTFILVKPCIMKKMDGQIDIRPYFFRFDDLNFSCVFRRIGQGSPN